MTRGGPVTDGELARYTDVDPPWFSRRIGSPARGIAGELDPDAATDDTSRTPAGSRVTSRTPGARRGRVLGARYRLGRQLGIGGYGAVFSADDLHGGPPVAIKVLSPVVERGSELLTRFHREAIATSRIRHPHIVEVTDFDVDDDGTHFIVMECLDGRDLAGELAEAGRFPPARALAIAAQCARGLAAAHGVGVLHRDLKPANVFLVRSLGGGEQVKVIDFGISKLTPLAGDYTAVTRASQVVGTPQYMPPEQTRGEELDGRADVYALGVMLFEMLTGERPFAGRSPLELFAQHVRARRRPPSALVPVLAACPGLDALVVTALAAERGQRFASMDRFTDAIDACLRAIAPDSTDELTECSGELTECSGELTGQRDVRARGSLRLAGRYRPVVAVLAAAAVVAIVLASPRRTGDPSPAPRPAATADALEAAPPLAPLVAPPVRVPALVATPPAVDAGLEPPDTPGPARAKPAPAPKRSRRPAVRRPKSAAARIGVAEW